MTGLRVEEDHVISQDAYRAGGGEVRALVEKRIRDATSVVLCSHGPVLPQIIASVAELTGTSGSSGTVDSASLHRAAALGTGEYAVLHVPIEHPESGIVAVEVHGPTA